MYTREKESVYTLESSILKCSTTRTLKDRLSILYQISMIAADQIDTLLSLFTMRTHMYRVSAFSVRFVYASFKSLLKTTDEEKAVHVHCNRPYFAALCRRFILCAKLRANKLKAHFQCHRTVYFVSLS